MNNQDFAEPSAPDETDIAIIGMAGRFPQAATLDQFWCNLRDGVECITFFAEADLHAAGVDPALLAQPNYVNARGRLDDVASFDATFFGYSPREAEITDPQQRLFLECAWEVLENAGYPPTAYPGRIGIYAGSSLNTYLLHHLYHHPDLLNFVGDFQLLTANDKDYLTTRTAYKLNLRGPSITVQTACSTSLVAIHLACQSLLNGECDMALAGGVSIMLPQDQGYLYREGGILSPDGHCRAFDAQAQGTVSGCGAGLVVLKRLESALADGDCIDAVIKGSAINNDGALKIGFTAPSIDGQAEVIAEALAVARVDPETISYVEAHGTGTPLGDPIEIAALTQVFGPNAAGSCALGSVKTNIGHLDTASGVAGLIKTVLALQHRQLPPSLHFQSPNPEIDLAHSPFYVNTTLREWPAASPRRAGVSSFGIGGANAHVVLEEAPARTPAAPSRPWQLLLLSAKTASALNNATAQLAQTLRQQPQLDLADVAYTLQIGRTSFGHRRMLVCRDHEAAVQALEMRDPAHVLTSARAGGARPVVFMFPGQGAQQLQMGRELYQHEPVFRTHIDRCAELLRPHLGLDVREVLYGDQETRRPGDTETRRHGDTETRNETNTQSSVLSPQSSFSGPQLDQTQYAQPALFVVEYALAQLWMAWGIRPHALIGHSLGEYVAACLAGVFSLEDALALVAARGRLMQELPSGAMLSVPLPEDELLPLLEPPLALAAVNGPNFCAVAGPTSAIDRLEERLAQRGIVARRLHTAHAFHSAMMDPIVVPFVERVRRCALRPPRLPLISNVSGTWITPEEATDPRYWGQQLRETVRFGSGLATLLDDPERVLLEVGPGRTLITLARQTAAGRIALGSLPPPQNPQPESAFLLNTLGQLWLSGVAVAWAQVHAGAQRQRVHLPSYPFERQRYWIEAPRRVHPAGESLSPQSTAQAAPADAAESYAPPVYALHPRPALPTDYIAPRSPLEQRLADIWQDLLGIAPLGIYDDFFVVGGHSLMATQLLTRLHAIFPVEVPLQQLYEAMTIAALAETLEGLLLERLEELPEDEAERLLQLIGAAG